ncbi:hypothetical protein NJB14197_43850 [Mycobacterium montefiorense]|uniref:VWFA domain-containing protein n=2 Tax=Mycobacterium montefiorense TaxID=154654 RepID=A0AA37PJX7_9MYCO|nr:hypothetical protein MmonteBS_32810 [Mycobacterium montefiorense]GKU32697.1 hypothetical protein NJB14191_00440 [Mycobacterium montefiorense]GKU43507.1 hypothetical protein NJB14194_01400 [Mycobacterium montefiorense]GKU58525.1 hypothetical protein NJB14197_43850 [Mycobacterium montefiorense]GKU63560.1 hypothetical protein NJB18182_40600 [Mycobacterium montefiorense]
MPGKSSDEPADESETNRFTARDLVSRFEEEQDHPHVEPHWDDLDEDDDADYDDYPDEAGGYADEDFAAAEDRYAAEGIDDEYPDFPPRPESSGPPEDARSGLFGSGHRVLGDWRGGHRSAGGRRGVSIGVIVALVAVILVVGTVILWSFFGDALSDRSHTAAARCVGGKETVAIVVDPSIAEHVQQFAEGYNSSAGPVADHCMVLDVKPAGSDAVIAGFIGKWPAELGAQPALWIPGSSVSAARLTAATGQKTISDSRSLVTSPVLLAVRPELQQVLSNQNWGALPGLQNNPNALAGLKLPAWGSLRLALPTSGNSDASYLAGEAVAAASVPSGAPATQGTAALRSLTGAAPKLADNSLTEAMNTLLKPGDVATAPVHAVITTEQQVFARGESLSDAKSTLASWLPQGPTPVADYPTVLLSGSWLTREQTSAASEFAHFIRKPEQLAKLAKAGFRVNGVKPPSSPVTGFAALGSTLSVGDDSMRATLADAMAAPSSGLAATIMLDQSMPGDEGGKSRLANVVAALEDRIKALPPNAILGLWTFDGHEGRSEVATGPLADQVNGQPRPAALAADLDKQYSSAGGAVSFTTLRMIYQEMQTNYHAGQTNSILLITAGPHTDQSLDGPGLQNFIRASADPAKPIAVNIIDFGADPDRATWEAVAQLSGGSYQNLATSASPDLATALSTYLG